MVQDTQQATEGPAPATTPSQGPMAMCPMAKMCAGMMGKRPSGVLLMLPGVLLIGVGALIVIEPIILIWLMAAASVLMGIMLLAIAGFVRKIGAQFRA
jgi:hypothetical protein